MSKATQCRCFSLTAMSGHKQEDADKYDLPEGLEIPEKFGKMEYPNGQPKTHVSIDRCIAHVVKRMWDVGLWTVSSCCGHNKCMPGIVFSDRITPQQAEAIERIIAEIDDRKFELLSWQLCRSTPEGVTPSKGFSPIEDKKNE